LDDEAKAVLQLRRNARESSITSAAFTEYCGHKAIIPFRHRPAVKVRDIDPFAHRPVVSDSAVNKGTTIPDPNHAVKDVGANSGSGVAGLGAPVKTDRVSVMLRLAQVSSSRGSATPVDV